MEVLGKVGHGLGEAAHYFQQFNPTIAQRQRLEMELANQNKMEQMREAHEEALHRFMEEQANYRSRLGEEGATGRTHYSVDAETARVAREMEARKAELDQAAALALVGHQFFPTADLLGKVLPGLEHYNFTNDELVSRALGEKGSYLGGVASMLHASNPGEEAFGEQRGHDAAAKTHDFAPGYGNEVLRALRAQHQGAYPTDPFGRLTPAQENEIFQKTRKSALDLMLGHGGRQMGRLGPGKYADITPEVEPEYLSFAVNGDPATARAILDDYNQNHAYDLKPEQVKMLEGMVKMSGVKPVTGMRGAAAPGPQQFPSPAASVLADPATMAEMERQLALMQQQLDEAKKGKQQRGAVDNQ